MKKTNWKTLTTSVCIAMMLIGLLSGCKKCVTCTERYSGYSSDYCGTSDNVKTFEKDLKEEGSKLGQDWTCVSK